MTGATLPGMSSRPAFHAPTAKKIWVYPCAFSSATEGAGVFSLISAPILAMRAASLSMASSEMRKPGITCRTMPPSLSDFSKRVKGMPARPRK